MVPVTIVSDVRGFIKRPTDGWMYLSLEFAHPDNCLWFTRRAHGPYRRRQTKYFKHI